MNIATRAVRGALIWTAALVAVSLAIGQISNPPTLADDTAALKAQTAFLEAQLAKLKAEGALDAQLNAAETAQAAADKAAKDARDKAQLETLNAVVGLAAKAPAGTYTATADGVASPKAMQLAFRNLDESVGSLYTALTPHLTKDVTDVVFAESLPSLKTSFELVQYRALIKDIAKEGIDLEVGTGGPKSVSAAAVITAVPALISLIGGFVRADYTEKVANANFSNSLAVTTLLGRIAGGDAIGAKVYLSADAYAFANFDPSKPTELIESFSEMATLDKDLEKAITAAKFKAEELAVANAETDLVRAKAKIGSLEYRRDFLAEVVTKGVGDTKLYKQELDNVVTELADATVVMKTLEKTVSEKKAELAVKTGKKDRMIALRERIAKLFTALRSTEGAPPLFVRLIRDEQLELTAAKADTVRFVTLSVAASPHSVITKKKYWSQSFKASSLVALEYRVANGNGKILAAGTIRSFKLVPMKLDEEGPMIESSPGPDKAIPAPSSAGASNK